MTRPIDPDLARRLDEILAAAPDTYIESRRAKLEDDWWAEWRQRSPHRVVALYDPEEVQAQIAWHIVMSDPYSQENLELKEFAEALDAGGEVTVTNIRTGEVVERWTAPGSPEGSAPSN